MITMRPIFGIVYILILFYQIATGEISFPVQLSSTKSQTFSLQDYEVPQAAIRKFCYEVFDSHNENCKRLVEYILNILSDRNGPESMWKSKEEDVLYSDRDPRAVFEWGNKNIKVNLYPLSGVKQSAILPVPPFNTHISAEVERFCVTHSISGLKCRALMFEVQNFVKATYFLKGGATEQNVLRGMYFQQELEIMYYPISMENPATGQVSKHFFFTDIQFAVPSVCKFCLLHNLPRERCKMVVDYTDKKMKEYYGSEYSGQLWTLQYVLNALHTIAQQHRQLTDSASPAPTSPKPTPTESNAPVTADFVEIGTSNFDTIIQLVDEADHFVGFSVEPSKHYLNSLPDKTGVTKVNCAIIKSTQRVGGDAAALSHSQAHVATPQFVDLYYIPEEVINNLNLYYYLKGCNSIGGYHPGHIEFGVQQHVVVEKVPAMSIADFLRTNNIHRIRLLKVDAEGYDLTIMQELYLHMINKSAPIVRVDRIIFESNDEEQRLAINELIRNLSRLGYSQFLTGENTILELQ